MGEKEGGEGEKVEEKRWRREGGGEKGGEEGGEGNLLEAIRREECVPRRL